MIKAERLSKKIGRKQIFKDINVTIQKGTITGIVGRNGAGKTTLLRTFAGILLPSTGTVTLNDRDIIKYPEVKQDLVFVPDSTEALIQYSIKEIVSLYKAIYKKFDEAYFYGLLEKFSMQPSGKIKDLSKGQKALFSLILAFSTRANFLLLDEPTDGLDVIVKKEILQFIAGEVAEHQVAVIISSHRLDELEALADRIIVLKDGVVESEMEMADFKEQYVKVQIAFQDAMPEELMKKVHLLHQSGRVYVFLMERANGENYEKLKTYHPILLEELPLSLEDVFVAKLGGDSYDF